MRIKVMTPPPGVAMRVQRGRNELLQPAAETPEELVFEFQVSVDLSSGSPNFLGQYTQGPKDARFIYVNSGGYGGQANTAWNRRAKISVMDVTREQVDKVVQNGAILETSFNGTGRDGGPTCASVKGIEWKVVNR